MAGADRLRGGARPAHGAVWDSRLGPVLRYARGRADCPAAAFWPRPIGALGRWTAVHSELSGQSWRQVPESPRGSWNSAAVVKMWLFWYFF